MMTLVTHLSYTQNTPTQYSTMRHDNSTIAQQPRAPPMAYQPLHLPKTPQSVIQQHDSHVTTYDTNAKLELHSP